MLRPLTVTVILAQPYLVLRLVGMLMPLPRWAVPAVFVGFVLSAGLLVTLPEPPPAATLLVVIYFVAVELAAATLLAWLSQRRFGLPRVRLAMAGGATALFGIAILIAGVASAATAGEAGAAATALSQLAALAAGLGYLAAFMPPRWLRQLAQRAVAFDLTHALVATPTGTEANVLWRQLAAAAQQILGARSVYVLDPEGRTIVASEGAEGMPHAASADSPETMVEVPLLAAGKRLGTLAARLDGPALFVEDDAGLLRLLASSTARTVQREDAVVRLSEARAALEASATVRASEARFRALLEAHPNAILAVDPAGMVAWSTGTAAELFGYSRSTLVGTPLSTLVQLDGDGVSHTSTDGAPIWRAETTAHRLDGSRFPVDIALSQFESEGEHFGLAVIADITRRHAADQIRDRFLGILSHELRTPITSIFGGTQLLLSRGERLEAQVRDGLLRDVAAEAERLHRIVENLLVLARVERGADLGGARPVLLNRVLTDLLDRERVLWPQVTINLDIPPDVPIVAADEEYLAQVMRNLLSNAAKYAGPGARVDVSVSNGGLEVSILVRDSGPGFAAEEADELFRLYFRSPEMAATPGAGIGLFVSRQLVVAMGGRMWARPLSDGGAEFGFTLPVYAEDEETAADDRDEARTVAPA
jgi:PAS domain S-box-containing protein